MSVLLTLATVATMSLVPSPVASASQASVKATPSVNVWHAPRLTKLVALARTWAAKKVPYVYGGGHGTHPGTTGGGFDCSGWVRYAYYQAFGVDFGAGTAHTMMRSGRFARTSHPVPGDVVAFNYEYGANPPSGAHVDHIGIYVGGKAPDGRPAMIDAPHTGVNLGLHGFDYGLIGYYHYKGATKADSGSLTPPKVKVTLNEAYSGNGTMVVVGHAYDPLNPKRSIAVDVYISGKKVKRVYTDAGTHRLSAHIATTPGKHAVRLKAYHVAGDKVSDAKSTQRVGTVKKRTIASLWSVHVGNEANGQGTIRVTGYGYDQLRPGTVQTMHLYVDGRLVRSFKANKATPEKNRLHGLRGNHGFDVTVQVKPGKHTVRVATVPIATYSSGGSSSTVATARVKAPIRARYDALTAGKGNVTVKAWALRPYATQDRVLFTITLDGKKLVSRFTAATRPDVNKAYHVKGTHGLLRTYRVAPGKHTVCLTANSMSTVSAAHQLGCKSVTVKG